jgi:hypothetical protein
VVSDSSRRFIDHADALLRRLEGAMRAGESPTPGVDLKYMVERIRRMREAAASGGIPPKEQRYGNLTRIIVDQWPLGDALGTSISELEDEYLHL